MSRHDTWRTSLTRVCDGGPRYFCAGCDLATQQIVSFRF